MNRKNETTERLSIDVLLASDEYQNSKMKLPCVLGVTENGDPLLFDLAKMPHVLIGGETDKGNIMHSILLSLLLKKSPEELKLVLIDSRKVEFTTYETLSSQYLARIPYKEESIITDINDALYAINSLKELMYERYSLLQRYRCRNIEDYNNKYKKGVIRPQTSHGILPYYVMMINEIGDYLMTLGKDFELPLACLAQLSRAVGIHVVISTRRLAYSVLTGIIKANFPCRIAVKTSSKNKSRIIMDFSGAEQLTGNGDMLITCGDKPVYVLGAFADIFNDIPEFCSKLTQQYAQCAQTLLPVLNNEPEESCKDMGSIGEYVFQYTDPLFEEAAKTVVEDQIASISFLQRKLKINYNRATLLFELLELAGIVSPQKNDSCLREVLIANTEDLMHKLLDIKMEIFKMTENQMFK